MTNRFTPSMTSGFTPSEKRKKLIFARDYLLAAQSTNRRLSSRDHQELEQLEEEIRQLDEQVQAHQR